MNKTLILLIFSYFTTSVYAQQAKNDIPLTKIPAGSFWMGSKGVGDNYDEAPVHKVTISKPFLMGTTPITNAQYEAYDPSHRIYRGIHGLSTKDNEAVLFVSYQNALDYCRWLSSKEGKTFRLPTEAEWEYACRAGTYSAYWMDDYLHDKFQRAQKIQRTPEVVDLQVGQTPANPFGLHDMHGLVEEWCLDWYGPYSSQEQTNPTGAVSGLFRVTRGGSHGTPLQFLRSANRSAMLPEDRHWFTGFRIVQADFPEPSYTAPTPLPFCMLQVSQQHHKWSAPVNEAIFKEPIAYVQAPDCNAGIPFYRHNHCPSITWCPNGDLLALWFSADQENGREMTILASRLRSGNTSWDQASEFFKVPDRNMTGSSIFQDKTGCLIYINGVEAAGDWQNLAMVQRTSSDNGATWGMPVLIAKEHKTRHQVIAGMIETSEGHLIQAADATPESHGGTAIHISKDGGKTWTDPAVNLHNDFKEGGTGGTIAGIHAGIVQLRNGHLMALGRGNSIRNAEGLERMPMSLSSNGGQSWTYAASVFPPIDGGQRLVLMRLNEGALLLVSFTHHPFRTKQELRGMQFTDKASGSTYMGYGMFAAISWDDGITWTNKKLLTDGKKRFLDGGAWTNYFLMDDRHAEPRGYLAATQTPDNMIHLLSSNLHYQFNLAWLSL